MRGIKLVELYEQPTQRTKNKWTLREVVVNPDYVVCLRPDSRAMALLQEGILPEGLDDRQEFTKIQMSRGNGGMDIVVVGGIALIEDKLNLSTKELLKG
tara:strand:+ start:3103 stop:3399 length:297 start_codon:yes stop_codon:yes gene_type:complete